jgi:hypothetical protein
MSTSTTAADEGDASAKAVATLRAALALRGHELYALAGGGWLVSRWGMSRELPDLAAVHRFAKAVGAVHG